MDKLLTYLHNMDSEHVVIGKENCNLLIIGDKSKTPTAVHLLLLTVGVAEPITDQTIVLLRNRYQCDLIFKRLFLCGKAMAKAADIPFLMVGYQTCPLDTFQPDAAFLDAMTFMVRKIYPTSGQEQAAIYKSSHFVPYLYHIMGVHYTDAGTGKEENKSVADLFHVWSRAKLSSHIVKQDFDAIYRDGNRFKMIEIKRSPTRSLSVWAPYSNDKRNYDIQNQVSKMLQAPFYTLHHTGGDCNENTFIGCYYVLDVNLRDVKSWIQYQKNIVAAGELLRILNQEPVACQQ